MKIVSGIKYIHVYSVQIFDLIMPFLGQALSNNLLRLFANTNWGFYIDDKIFPKSTFKGYSHIPVTRFRDPDEQQEAVSQITNIMLGALPGIERSDLSSFEWCLNEITDNVLVHSSSKVGGIVQVTTFNKFSKKIQFVVADAGSGIPKSLKQNKIYRSAPDTELLDISRREGITRDNKIGQGNGLFGCFEICDKSLGSFNLVSGYASLTLMYKNSRSFYTKKEISPYEGTLVVATIDFSQKNLLSNALKFNGKAKSFIDMVELKHESEDEEILYYNLSDDYIYFGSRHGGSFVRNKLLNLFRISGFKYAVVSFENINLISSSFADEAFGKMIFEIGESDFLEKFSFININPLVKEILDKSILQRLSVNKSSML
jgi:hypothetical protein